MTNQDLIRQYVDTGVGIPEYQFGKLSKNLKGTYLRKRIIGIGGSEGVIHFLEDWELAGLEDKQLSDYRKALMKLATAEVENGRFFKLSAEEYNLLTPQQQQEYDLLFQKYREERDKFNW